jgi:hypothetical protein
VEELQWVKEAADALTKKQALTDGQLEAICASSAMEASEALYEQSGRLFTGECGPATIRPVSRPTDIDMRSLGATLSPVGWYSSSGFSSAYGSFVPGVLTHYGRSDPPEIQIPWPVRAIVQVQIDGIVIPDEEYELRDAKTLVRIRPTASYVPTARYGWPTSQRMDLPDTQPGTFSITFLFGQDPPALGTAAALTLAQYIALPKLGDRKHMPQRVTSMQRQGISAQVVDVIDLLRKGAGTGIYEVDLFLKSVNPGMADRQGMVWSPDMGRPRRQAQAAP